MNWNKHIKSVAVDTTGTTAAARRVRFSSVVVYHFAVRLDASKLPTSGCAPLGLGALCEGDAEKLSVDEFEAARGSVRRSAAGLLLGHGARLALLSEADTEPSELEAVEAERDLYVTKLRDVERRVQTRPADESAAELALAITRILYDNGSPAAPPVTPTPRD